MLYEALGRKPYLKRWLEKYGGADGGAVDVRPENLRDLLKAASAYPAVLPQEEE